jgi:hypothetical protein
MIVGSYNKKDPKTEGKEDGISVQANHRYAILVN